jgi:hypothetical protein
MTGNTELLPPLAREQGVTLFGIAVICILLASGVLTNERSYVFAVLIAIFGIRPQIGEFSFWRKFVLSLAFIIILFGVLKGFFRGNDIQHIGRFAIPLTTFFIFCLLPGIGVLIYRCRLFIASVVFIFTLLFYYLVKSGEFQIADEIMAGWSFTYSSNAAVSVWHYFSMPFCICIIVEKIFFSRESNSIFFVVISTATIIMLLMLTDTSSFAFSLFFIIFAIFVPLKLSNFLRLFIFGGMIIAIFDFLTLKIISRYLVDFFQFLGVNDPGDLLRIIQLEYFVEQVEFFGSGFGARHDFPFIVNDARLTSQIIYPYASELPILNIIFNGGVFSAIWFLVFIYLMLYHVRERARVKGLSSGVHIFAIGCGGVFIGSMSNPYLFAPASMLLLAIIFDLADLSGEARRNGTQLAI